MTFKLVFDCVSSSRRNEASLLSPASGLAPPVISAQPVIIPLRCVAELLVAMADGEEYLKSDRYRVAVFPSGGGRQRGGSFVAHVPDTSTRANLEHLRLRQLPGCLG